jgi:SAM-dependent methyltransferase
MKVFTRAMRKLGLFLFFRLTWVLARVIEREERVRIHLGQIEQATKKEERLRIFRDETALLIEPEERILIPSFEQGHGPEQDRFHTYQQRHVAFKIKPGEKVLDIGSGAYPFPYATHLADLYEGGTTHRTEPLVRTDLPFEVCDIERLPYKDQEFEFVYCSHVLEHVKDPARACEEIMRVGRRGYIETPTRASDIMLNFIRLQEHHRWHINLLGNTLIFLEWTDNERRDTGINTFYVLLHSKYHNAFQDLVHRHRDLFVNMLQWEERFHYYVFDKSGTLMTTNDRARSAL